MLILLNQSLDLQYEFAYQKAKEIMVLPINVFTTIIEIFWVHTELSFEDCLKHCLGWFKNSTS